MYTSVRQHTLTQTLVNTSYICLNTQISDYTDSKGCFHTNRKMNREHNIKYKIANDENNRIGGKSCLHGRFLWGLFGLKDRVSKNRHCGVHADMFCGFGYLGIAFWPFEQHLFKLCKRHLNNNSPNGAGDHTQDCDW